MENVYYYILGFYIKEKNVSKNGEGIKYFFITHDKLFFKTKNFPFFQNILKLSKNYKILYNELIQNFKNKEIEKWEIKEISNNNYNDCFNNNYIKCLINNKVHLIFSFDNNNMQKMFDFWKNLQTYFKNSNFIKCYKKDYINFYPLYNDYIYGINSFLKKNNDKFKWMNTIEREKAVVIDNNNEINNNKNNNFIKLNNNSLYSGNINDNKEPEGNGKELTECDNVYIGNFLEGKWFGKGYIANNKTKSICHGEFINGKIRGI